MRRIFCFACLSVLVLALTGCMSGLYFGTATSVGLDVSGTGKVPNKVSFAYDRGEVVIIPEDTTGTSYSVFASLDSEWTWTEGFYVKQKFATGEAADIVSAGRSPDKSGLTENTPARTARSGIPLLFTTGTKLGIALEFGQTDSAPMSFLVGYRRAELTLMPNVVDKPEIESVYADISIDSRDITITGSPATVPVIGGVRIKQSFATGRAAINAAADPTVRDNLRKAVYSGLDAVKSRYDKEGGIWNKFKPLTTTKKNQYLNTLNGALGRSGAALLTPDNFHDELGNLPDKDLETARKQIESL